MTVPGESGSGIRDDETADDIPGTTPEPASKDASPAAATAAVTPAVNEPDPGQIDHRRLAEVFGSDAVFPESTGDDRDPAADDGAAVARTSWFNENRPPHHDR